MPVENAEIVVVGAGIVGSLITYHLAEAGYDVVCLEQWPKAGQVSTIRSSAAFRQQFGNTGEIKLALLSSAFYERCPQLLGTDTVLDRKGYLFLHRFEQGWAAAQKAIELQRSVGVHDVVSLSPEEVSTRFPYVDTLGLLGATFCPTDGFFSEDPAFIAQSACEKAIKKGARVFFNHQVIGIETESPRAVTGIWVADAKDRAKQHKIKTRLVVNAAGAAASVIAEKTGSNLDIYGVKRYLYFTPTDTQELLKEKQCDLEKIPMIVCDLGAHVRPWETKLIYIWTMQPPEPNFEAIEKNLEIHEKNPFTEQGEKDYEIESDFQPRRYGRKIWERLVSYLPILESVPPEVVTSGYYEMTRSHRACIDWDGRVAGLFHCAGFSGHGIMLAPGAAQLVLDKIERRLKGKPRELLALDPYFSYETYNKSASGLGTI